MVGAIAFFGADSTFAVGIGTCLITFALRCRDDDVLKEHHVLLGSKDLLHFVHILGSHAGIVDAGTVTFEVMATASLVILRFVALSLFAFCFVALCVLAFGACGAESI